MVSALRLRVGWASARSNEVHFGKILIGSSSVGMIIGTGRICSSLTSISLSWKT